MWFDPGLAGLFITSTLLHLGEDINLFVVSTVIPSLYTDDIFPSVFTDGVSDGKIR